MNKFVSFNSLTSSQLDQYHDAITKAFPQVISESPIIKKLWLHLENYFPEFQKFLIGPDEDLIGFINTVPFQFEGPLNDLPDEGWDWMLSKGISDYEEGIRPNLLGGLQVIVRKKYQRLGYSQKILSCCKKEVSASHISQLVIPIRPTKKHLFPKVSMTEYLSYKDEGKIFDPWIRTHVKGGAEIIKICECSMFVDGNIEFWERILGRKIYQGGDYLLDGALSPIKIDFQKNLGEYREPNVWIKYEA